MMKLQKQLIEWWPLIIVPFAVLSFIPPRAGCTAVGIKTFQHTGGAETESEKKKTHKMLIMYLAKYSISTHYQGHWDILKGGVINTFINVDIFLIYVKDN